jgi:threonine dehydrogenase-like Zn-dependent dehydrogenase
VLGVYGLTDKFPMGNVTNKGLTLKSAQQHGHRYIAQFFDLIQQGDLDPSVLITHELSLEQGVRAYDMFKNKQDGCIRVALRP